ncbi:MAG: UDP-glucuronic acid decarboxylase family protein [Burkholderiaceae bacterium]
MSDASDPIAGDGPAIASGAFEDRRVLVTGAAGFIGSHLCEALLARGARVTGVDNLLSGARSNLARLAGKDGFTLIEHDVAEPLDIDAGLIINLACPASPIDYQRHPVETIKASVLGAMHLLELARRRGATIVQASTSEIYGDPREHPQRESYWGHVNPIGARACYNESKRCAETMFVTWRTQYNLDTRIARLFNVYGPRMRADDGRVVSNFIVQALRGAPVTVYGDGSQTRSFCYVDDIVDGLLRLAAAPAASAAGPINLGNPQEITVAALAQRIVALCGSRSALRLMPLPADDPVRRCPDIALARATLGWQPRIELDEGLEATIRWFRSRSD